MDTLGIIALVLAVVGIAGSVLPVIPGPPLSWAALLCVYFSDKADPVPMALLVALLILATAVTILDYVIPGMLTRMTGGSKQAERGALIGLFAGIILTPVGMVLGSFLGALIGEYSARGNDLAGCLKAAAGTFLGFILSTGIKVIYSVSLLLVTLFKII